MFANRFSAMVDACVLVSALKRNLVLSLAEAEFFQVRWSVRILEETERALVEIHRRRGADDAVARASRGRREMERAFEDATVRGYESLVDNFSNLPDPGDGHVIAAAVKTRASVIVTDNLRHFPAVILSPLDLEAKEADVFIADTIDLDVGRAVAAVRRMRERFRRPEMGPAALLLSMEAAGLTFSVDVLRGHVRSL